MTLAPILRLRHAAAAALACVLVLTACNSADREHASQMTSYSAGASSSAS